jgi:ketosteroid isomerase-like protein
MWTGPLFALERDTAAAMSENLELVRSIYAEWERGDYSSVEWADPAIEFTMVGVPAPGTWTGLAEMARAWREWLSAWEDWHEEVEEYRELDSERVLVLLYARGGRGKASAVDLDRVREVGGACVFHIRRGRVSRLVAYWDRDSALADLGLKE